MPHTPLSTETRLVFRTADPAVPRDELVALAGGVRDWTRVVELAEREGAAASLWRSLGALGSMPPEVADHLRKSTMVSDFRMQLLARRGGDAVRALHASGIPVLLLKGAAVGARSDPTFRSRPMTDIDLLIRRGDAARARDTIIAAGWPETTDLVLLALLRDAHHLAPFVEPSLPGARLELHVALLPADHSFVLDEEELWRDATPTDGPFAGALVPSREHLAWHTAVHFAWQHLVHFGAWRTFRSIGLLQQDPGFAWPRFVDLAKRSRAGTACYWTLRMARHLAGFDVPADVLARLAPPTPRPLLGAIERHFTAAIAPGESPRSPSQQLSRLLWRAALRPRWSGYRAPGRFDPDHRWERALGTLSTESRPARIARHLAGFGGWWRFFVRTLF